MSLHLASKRPAVMIHGEEEFTTSDLVGGEYGYRFRKVVDRRAEDLWERSMREHAKPNEEARKVLHDLRVHHIELELQNEELRRAQAELEASRARYFDLYDLAPVGYCMLSEKGLILEANLTNNDAHGIYKDMGIIHRVIDKMFRLLDDLRDLSGAGRIMNTADEAPLQAIAREALDLVAGQIAERGVLVEVTNDPVMLHGDRERLVEVFQNLVDNAVKFMGHQPAPRVEIGVEHEGAETVFLVRDNGMGIEPRHQANIFGIFEKLDSGVDGTGIGPALVKRIVEAHGGTIRAESDGLGKGSTFRFTLAKTRCDRGREETP